MAKATEKKDQQLIPLQEVNATTLFGSDDKQPLAKILATINTAVQDLTFDMDKAAGRKECASVAYNVARSKTAIDEAGKAYVADLKNKAKVVDERRRFARENLDALRDKVRAPLDRWEENENARVQGHTDAIAEIRQAGNDAHALENDLGALTALRARVVDVNPADFEEFEENANETRLAAMAKIDTSIYRAEQIEREREELEQLRKEKAEREEADRKAAAERAQAEREEQIRKEAAEEAEREKDAEIKAAKEAAERAEREKQEAVDRAARAQQEAKEEQDRIAAEAQRERELEEQRQKDLQEARERNTRYKGKCNTEAVEALMEQAKLGPTQARKVVEAIVKGKIPRVTLSY